MKLDALVDALKHDEAFRPAVYDDATGKPIVPGSIVVGWPTIGYGWNCAANPMSKAQAEERLRYDAINALRDCADLIPNWLYIDDVRQNVLANMAFNLGKAKLATFTQLLSAVSKDDYAAAAAEMKDSKWFAQVGARAVRLADEMLTGVEQPRG